MWHASPRLFQNSPNPFNPETLISFVVPAGVRDVELSIYGVSGALIEQWSWMAPIPGLAHVDWDGRNQAGSRVASGVYFCRLDVDGRVSTRKMVLLK